MNKNGTLAIVLVATFISQLILVFLWDSIVITAHEYDILHTLAGAIRLAEGERVHLDFMTPLGLFAFAPTSFLLNMGFTSGASLAYSGFVVALLVMPAIYWVSKTRLNGWPQLLWSVWLVLLLTASVHGGIEAETSFSMSYNRWAWAIAMLLVIMVVLPAKVNSNKVFEGVIIGLGIASLAMMKMTFFLAFTPIIILSLVWSRQWKEIAFAILSGLAIFALVSIWAGGFDYWFAYYNDLSFSLQKSVRVTNGGWDSYISSPPTIMSMIVLMSSVVLLMLLQDRKASIQFLLLTPSFIFVTYQNWGADPKFLTLVALLIWVKISDAKRGEAWKPLVYICLGMITVNGVTIATSNIRPVIFVIHENTPILTGLKNSDSDLNMTTRRFETEVVSNNLFGNEYYFDTFDGVTHAYKECRSISGYIKNSMSMVQDLLDHGFVDRPQVMIADSHSFLWMVGDVTRLDGGAIWQYGGDYGFDNLDVLIVPECALSTLGRKSVLDAFFAKGLSLVEITRNDIAGYYRVIH